MWSGMGTYGWGSGWGWIGVTHMLLWWALLILGITLLAKWLLAPASRRQRGALEILRERYARGEIDKDEFDRRRRDLLA